MANSKNNINKLDELQNIVKLSKNAFHHKCSIIAMVLADDTFWMTNVLQMYYIHQDINAGLVDQHRISDYDGQKEGFNSTDVTVGQTVPAAGRQLYPSHSELPNPEQRFTVQTGLPDLTHAVQ
jgi:hypothetical protein